MRGRDSVAKGANEPEEERGAVEVKGSRDHPFETEGSPLCFRWPIVVSSLSITFYSSMHR